MTTAAIAHINTDSLIDSILDQTDAQRRAGAGVLDEATEKHDRNVALLTARVKAIKSAKFDAVADTRALRAVGILAGDNHPAQVVVEAPNGFALLNDDAAAIVKLGRDAEKRSKNGGRN